MFYVLLAVFGLCLGSFVNALVWRLHEKESPQHVKGKRAIKVADLSIVKGRSMCPDCHHTLAVKDLVPVLSWLSLKGKCRYCRKPIAWQYPVVETITALLFVISWAVWPFGTGASAAGLFGLWLAFLLLAVALVVYDLRWMLLPNRLVYPLIGVAVLQVLWRAVIMQESELWLGAVLGLLSVGGLFYGLFQVSKGKWIGGGDVKLGFSLGLLAGGMVQGFLLIFIASALGSIVSLLLLARKGSLARRIPFGPFLLTGAAVVYLFGQRLLDWYTAQLL